VTQAMNGADLGPFQVRTLFLSDVHLGTRACQAERLLAFLKRFECERLYLVGDIIDFWALRRSVHWPTSHNTVVQKILRRARHGTRITYVVGNHDEALREYLNMAFGGIELIDQCVHRTADGQEYLVIHGDRYDQVTHYARWLSVLGDLSYHALIEANRLLSLVRRRLGLAGHWSLADYAKRNVLKAVAFVGEFEHAVARDVRALGLKGVICGHIHTPVIKPVEGVQYLNCGDWVDSCSAIVEHLDGRLELVRQVGEEDLVALATTAIT
jgi:UDP-2,3-diacylglucosamine pyrophosphatase LpxH